MPITPYVRPQETITQILRMTPAPSVNRRNPLVIGPEYLLGNYDPTNRFQEAYDALLGSVSYSYLDADGIARQVDTDTHTVDTTSVKLYGQDIEVRVSGQATEVAGERGAVNTAITVADAESTKFFTGPIANLVANLNERAVRIGDVLYVTIGGTTYRRTVVGFTTDTQGRATEILLNGIIPGAANTALTFYVVSLYTGPLDSSVLTTGSLAGISAGASSVTYNAFIFKKSVMGVDATGVDCTSSVHAESKGKVSAYFRAVRQVTELDGVITINSLSDLDQLGPLHVDNWLAYGAYLAFKGNQSAKTYVLRTGGDTLDAFSEALDKIRSTDYYYALAPMTDRDDVKEYVAAHCDEMSNKYNRNFRRCYVGTDTPAGFRIWGLKSDGSLRQATIDNVNKRIVIATGDQGVSNFSTDLSVGDTIKVGVTLTGQAINESSGDALTISRIISASEIEYTGTTAATNTVAITGTRKDSSANVVKYFTERNIGSRRCVNVWCDKPVTFGAASSNTGASANSVSMPMKFVAAEIAGLRCALLPQQGLTMTEVLSVDAAPGMYTRFTPEQLDTIASHGVMVVTQEIEGGEMFIRHQLTTQTNAGALAYEDNVGVIVDEFSYRVKDAFRQYLGRRNVTQETLAEIAAKLKDLAIESTQESIANREIGPMVIRFFNEQDKEGEVTVRVDGNLADHILTYVRLRVPLPINGIDHYIDVETSVEL